MDIPTSAFTLLEQAQAGDGEALSGAFEKYQRRLAVLVHFKLSDRTRDGRTILSSSLIQQGRP
jgi:hypothetical protein